jgi:hypothetical protein
LPGLPSRQFTDVSFSINLTKRKALANIEVPAAYAACLGGFMTNELSPVHDFGTIINSTGSGQYQLALNMHGIMQVARYRADDLDSLLRVSIYEVRHNKNLSPDMVTEAVAVIRDHVGKAQNDVIVMAYGPTGMGYIVGRQNNMVPIPQHPGVEVSVDALIFHPEGYAEERKAVLRELADRKRPSVDVSA